MLITLAYRVPRAAFDTVLGTVTAYPLTAEFSNAWQELPKTWDSRNKRSRTPPYASLATALCGATGQHVRMFATWELADRERDAGNTALLLTTVPINEQRLHTAVQTWERLTRHGTDLNLLAPLLPTPDPARPFSDFIVHRPGAVPSAPNWVFRTVAWRVAQRLASKPLRIDGRTPLELRQDTDGNLLAWKTEDLISNPRGTAYAMARISVRLVTYPGVTDPVLCFDAHLSRIDNRWRGVKNTWIEQGKPDSTILRLPVRHRRNPEIGAWETLLGWHVTEILAACNLDPINIDRELPASPGAIRPQVPKTRRHPLGSGLGARFMFRLHEHITATIPELQPLSCEREPRLDLIERIKKRDDRALPSGAVNPSGFQQVKIVCLYASAEARDRMLAELGELTGHQLRGLPDNTHRLLNDRLHLVVHRTPELLSHGLLNRATHLGRIPNLGGDENTLVVAWLETEYHPRVPIPSGDAKPHLRRLLARQCVPCQFLASEPQDLPEGVTRATVETKKHKARSSLRDLLRAGGIVDSRLANAVANPKLNHRLDRPTLLVGIHARRQLTDDQEPPLVLTMTAVYADPNDDTNWRILMHSTPRQSWQPVGPGIADFHTGNIGERRLGRTDEKAALTREHVEKQLAALLNDQPYDLPVVIFVDAQAARSIWPGLQNQHFADGPLPGDSLAHAGQDIAIVRCNNTTQIGRPVTRHAEGQHPDDPQQPAAPGRRLYKVTDADLPIWLFAGTSRTYNAKGGNAGARHTRWTIPADYSAKELRTPWHAYTAIEIAVVQTGSWQPITLAALTARLCDQPISWDGRTTLPVPLHLAICADKDHPDYRSADTLADADADQPTEEQPAEEEDPDGDSTEEDPDSQSIPT